MFVHAFGDRKHLYLQLNKHLEKRRRLRQMLLSFFRNVSRNVPSFQSSSFLLSKSNLFLFSVFFLKVISFSFFLRNRRSILLSILNFESDSLSVILFHFPFSLVYLPFFCSSSSSVVLNLYHK